MPKLSWNIKKVKEKINAEEMAQKLSSDYDKRLEADGVDTDKASAKSAKRAHFVGICALVLCAAIILSMLLIFGKDIGPMNLYNFFREVALMGQVGEGEREQISYSQPTRNQSFSEFKRGFIVASDREVQVFNKAGYETLIDQLSYSNPMIATSKNTFIVYDLGGLGFTLYNAFEDMYSETREYPISAAHMSEDGKFAIVGKSERHNTEVVMYDSDGKRELSYKRGDLAVDCKYNEKGNHLALLTLDAFDGEYIYTLTVLSTKNGEVVSSVEGVGDLPYGCYYLGNDRIAVLLDDSLVIYNNKCEEIGTYEYPQGKLYKASVTDKSIALLFTNDRVNMQNTLYIIDSKGKLDREIPIEGEFSDMEVSSKYAYFAAEGGVYRLELGTGKLQFAAIDGIDGDVIILDGNRVMLARPNMSYIITAFS